jgi:hypothetical protein
MVELGLPSIGSPCNPSLIPDGAQEVHFFMAILVLADLFAAN